MDINQVTNIKSGGWEEHTATGADLTFKGGGDWLLRMDNRQIMEAAERLGSRELVKTPGNK